VDVIATAWTLGFTAVALFATLPGLALFYGAFTRARSTALLLQNAVVASVVSVLWIVLGYSIAFSSSGMAEGVINLRSFVGGLSKAGLAGVTEGAVVNASPELAWVLFQLVFAMLPPCIMLSAFLQRLKLSAVVSFTALWTTMVYLPVAHSVWSGPGAFLGDLGTLDYAGALPAQLPACCACALRWRTADARRRPGCPRGGRFLRADGRRHAWASGDCPRSRARLQPQAPRRRCVAAVGRRHVAVRELRPRALSRRCSISA